MINAGTKLGAYEITGAIGAGGMGEVYRARDTKLGRDVAIKVLPEAFARDTDRMARFQREAKVLASLNHPNIASIYGLEDSGPEASGHALVMELVEGPTLADRIKQGPIPVEEALKIARQICEALEYAHERGIVHRDLKPANVKVTADDAVKTLDFGLAKAMEGDAASLDISTSPTISRMATMQGVLLGTAAYMSPEQAKAKPVDRRADIWAFGCVLYEMLTGKMAFHGETITDTLAAVVTKDPDWSLLPAATPPHVRVLLQRCLQKDPKQRLRDIGDARISVDEVLSGAPEAATLGVGRPALQRWLWLISGVAAVLAVAAAFLMFMHFRQQVPPLDAMRFEIGLPEKLSLGAYFGLSPDGRELAFIGSGEDGQNRVWVRSFESLVARPLDGTEGAYDRPFWSPDSRSIGFLSEGKLKKIDASGGPPIALCEADGLWGGAWTKDNKIVFGSNLGTFIVDASGGKPSQITDGLSATPLLLPDGRHFIYFHDTGVDAADTGAYLSSLDAKPEQRSRKLLGDYSMVAYVPSSDPTMWRLLFVRGATAGRSLGTLMAQRFDTQRLELVGEAVPIAEQVPDLSFAASSDVIVYLAGSLAAATPGGAGGDIRGQLTWFNRDGKILEAVGEPGTYRTLALSPDGKRVAFERADPLRGGSRNIWLYEFARGVTTRFTFDSGWETDPVWSPDGNRIVFGSVRDGNWSLYQKASNLVTEDAPLLKSSAYMKLPSSWSPDGRFLLYYTPLPPAHIWLLPLGGEADRKPVRLDNSEFNEAYARVSPDGRWIAYDSDESGRYEIYVRPVDVAPLTGSSSAGAPPVTGKWMVSKGGGTNALWRRDGKELFYLGLDGSAMAVEVSSGESFQAGIPKVLFKLPEGVLFWDVSPDGKRFLMTAPSAASANTESKFAVVLNWQAALKK